MTNAVTSYNGDHLGLVAEMIDKLGLVSLIDSLIPQDLEQRQVSVGLRVKVILNDLGSDNDSPFLTINPRLS